MSREPTYRFPACQQCGYDRYFVTTQVAAHDETGQPVRWQGSIACKSCQCVRVTIPSLPEGDYMAAVTKHVNALATPANTTPALGPRRRMIDL